MESEISSKLDALMALSLVERRQAVVGDIGQRAPLFEGIPAHDLADALELPGHWNPGSEWSFIRYASIVRVEEYVRDNFPASEVVYLIEDAVPRLRFQEILSCARPLDDIESPVFDFLTEAERNQLERAIACQQLEANESNGMCCIGRCSIESSSGTLLEFEGDVEDDGTCITLRTPYDKQANRFVDLSECVTSEW